MATRRLVSFFRKIFSRAGDGNYNGNEIHNVSLNIV